MCVCVCVCVQIRIDQTDNRWSYQNIYLGVVTQSPDAITIPFWAGDLWSAVVVHHDWVKVNGVEVRVENTHRHARTHARTQARTHIHTKIGKRWITGDSTGKQFIKLRITTTIN